MGIVEAYKALKDISYRASNNTKLIEVVTVDEGHVMICKGDTCFELQKPQLIDKELVIPVLKWSKPRLTLRRRGDKYEIMERKYITLNDLNHFMNTYDFRDFVKRMKNIKEVETDISRLYKFFDYLYTLFI
ncbi:hypothetical protein AVT97_gp04 [Sulfolobales Virus YNP2]|uniref:hypothetical protein n=1 Tax=Sulfolobales Virus YNP2 TaxID=1732180 RepID=UPI0007062C19|nr:hypothetical protein AVT97_gp04 [Sulfolobales Virus YNP2]ALG97167.1 hypothetical protein [Sulfolobales Virus YNP2]